jgi:hypothetical protein
MPRRLVTCAPRESGLLRFDQTGRAVGWRPRFRSLIMEAALMRKSLSYVLLLCSMLILPSGHVWSKNDSLSSDSVGPQKMQAGAWRGSQLMGINVHSTDGNRVGFIADIVGDIKGQVVYVILSVGGVLGIGDKLIPLPWQVLAPGEKSGTLKVQLSKKDLEQAPNFDPNNWPDFNESEWKIKTQKYYEGLGTKKKEKSK